MAYFEPQIYRVVNAGPLRFDIMKVCCMSLIITCMRKVAEVDAFRCTVSSSCVTVHGGYLVQPPSASREVPFAGAVLVWSS